MNIESLRKYCLSLPGTIEDVKWGADLCFTIGSKMYCVTGLEGDFKVSFKCTEADFESLVERNDIIPAPYLARNKWVMVANAGALSKTEWEFYINNSYLLIASKLPSKLKKDLNIKI